MSKIAKNNDIANLSQQIKKLIIKSREHVSRIVNNVLVLTYWNIGKLIVEKQDGDALIRLLSDEHFKCDLVFYNTIIKCYLVVDLKVGKLSYQDVGQIDLYRRYFDDRVKEDNDNPTIGLLLVDKKDETIIKYSVLNENENLHVSKYLAYLTKKEDLLKLIEEEKRLIKK